MDNATRERQKELVKQLALGKISNSQFLDQFPDRSIEKQSFIRDTIRTARESYDGWLIELAEIMLELGRDRYKYTIDSSELCSLLFEDWHYSHEDIAFDLQRLAGRGDVECLYEASQLTYDHLAYDDTYQYARKCIKALFKIGTPEAIDKLKLLAANPNEMIAGHARKELNRLAQTDPPAVLHFRKKE